MKRPPSQVWLVRNKYGEMWQSYFRTKKAALEAVSKAVAYSDGNVVFGPYKLPGSGR